MRAFILGDGSQSMHPKSTRLVHHRRADAMSRFNVSQVLNHTINSRGTAVVTAVYDRNAFKLEKRAALDAWANLLQEIVGGRERVSNTEPLAR